MKQAKPKKKKSTIVKGEKPSSTVPPPKVPFTPEGDESMLLEYEQNGTVVRIVDLCDPIDTREQDDEKWRELQELETSEEFSIPKSEKRFKGLYKGQRFDVRAQKRFLNKLAETGLLTLACAYTPVTRKTVLIHRKASKSFNSLYDQAITQYSERLESELMRRAVKGVKRPVFQKGCLVGYERQYSDRLMELTIKKHNQAYRDKMQVDANITGGVLVVAPMAKDQQEWEERYGNLRRPNGENGKNHQEEKEEEVTKKGKVHVIQRS